MNVYEKLQTARVQLQDKKIKKSGKNSYSGFDYFELADFLPEINSIFNSLKLFSLFKLAEKSASLTIYNAETPDEFVEFTMPAASLTLKGCNELQALGGANTYCRRYLYLNALEIVESDVFDAETGREEAKKPARKNQKQQTIFKEEKKETPPALPPEKKETPPGYETECADLIIAAKECRKYEDLGRLYKENFKNLKKEYQKPFNDLVRELQENFAHAEASQIY